MEENQNSRGVKITELPLRAKEDLNGCEVVPFADPSGNGAINIKTELINPLQSAIAELEDNKANKSDIKVVSDVQFAMLEAQGRVDASKIYYVYESDGVADIPIDRL